MKNCHRLAVAFIWGAILASFLQWHRMGQFLAERRTWITVATGIGVDWMIAYPYKEESDGKAQAKTMLGVIVASSIPIIFRSLWIEWANRTYLPAKMIVKRER